MEVTFYDGAAEKLLDMKAQEFARLWETQEKMEIIRGRLHWHRVMLMVRAKKEVWQEMERMKYSINDARSAKGVDYAIEGRRLLAEVLVSIGERGVELACA